MKSRDILNVVVADDSPITRQGLRELLRGIEGVHVVAEAADAPAAIRALQDLRPDAIVLDLSMPGGGGMAVLDHLHHDPAPPLRIVLTCHAEPQYRRRCLAAGADCFLNKSTEFEEVARVLDQRRCSSGADSSQSQTANS